MEASFQSYHSRFCIQKNTVALCGVCVVDSYFKQPHLAQVRWLGLWGQVRLHTCGALG